MNLLFNWHLTISSKHESLPSNSNILFPNKVGKTLGSGEKDCVGDVVDPRTDHRQACSWENVSVVSLAWFKSFAKAFEGGERGARGKESSALRVDVSLLSRALSLAGGVGQSEDNWTRVEARHVLDDLGSEHVGDGSRADEHSWLQLPNNVGKFLHRIVGMRKWHLV